MTCEAEVALAQSGFWGSRGISLSPRVIQSHSSTFYIHCLQITASRALSDGDVIYFNPQACSWRVACSVLVDGHVFALLVCE